MNARFLRFLLAGAANTAVTYAAYLVLLKVLPYLWAYSLTYAGGIVLAYFIQARYVFRASTSWRTFVKFPLVYAVQYGAGYVAMHYLVESGLVSEKLALLFTLCLTVPLGFALSRWLLEPRSEQQ